MLSRTHLSGNPLGSETAPLPPSSVPEPKKSNTLKFVLFGCLGILVLAAIGTVGAGWFFAKKVKEAGFDSETLRQNPALAAAKMAVAVNPDLEVLDVDERRSRIRVRQKSTGKILLLDFEKAQQGQLVFEEEGGGRVSIGGQQGEVRVETPEGTAVYGGKAQAPGWMPEYSGAQSQGAFTSTGADGQHGTYTFKTSDPVSQVAGFFQREFQSKGYEVKETASFSSGPTEMKRLSIAGEGKKIEMTVLGAGGATTVTSAW